jgi:hypothetical protein
LQQNGVKKFCQGNTFMFCSNDDGLEIDPKTRLDQIKSTTKLWIQLNLD